MVPNPYDVLAAVYDQDTHTEAAQEFGDILEEHIRQRGIRPRRILDVGCGTGVLASRLVEANWALVIAVDRSLGMLRRARARLDGSLQAALVAAHMVRLPFYQCFDMIVACNEVVNQVPPTSLELVVRELVKALQPGGWLVFDSLTVGHFRRFWDNRHWEERNEGGILWMDCEWREARGDGLARCIVVSVSRQDARIDVASVMEYYHDPTRLEQLLALHGLAVTQLLNWNPYPEPQPEGFTDRHFWICRRGL